MDKRTLPRSKESNKARSEAMKKRWAEGVFDDRDGTGKRKPCSEETKKKLSKAMKKSWKQGKWDTETYANREFNSSGRGRGGFRKDIGHYVRSRWEANYARYMNWECIDYLYEPETFYLKELDCRYTPDFVVGDYEPVYIEVKGYDTPEHRKKREAFRKQYGYKLKVIGPKRYYELEGKYGKLIKGWEKKER